MADSRALGVFRERVKSALGSLLEALLVEITEAYRESLGHCDRCANDWPETRSIKDRVVSGDGQPLMGFQCSEAVTDPEETLCPCPSQELGPSERTEKTLTTTDDRIIQSTLSVSDNQTFPETPEASEELSVTEAVIKEEYEDEDDECESRCLEETQACQTSCESPEAQLKPEESSWSPSSSGGYFSSVRTQITQSCLMSTASGERLGPRPKDAPVRACSVLLPKPKILQRSARRFHVCGDCDKIFVYRRTLRRHRRFHTGERPYGCSMCSRAFILRRTLREHTRAHFRRPYSCTQCEKRFKRWRKLRRHWRSHAGESPFVCSRCGKHCRTLNSLDRHLAYFSHS